MKKPAISVFSILSLLISLAAFLVYYLMLNGGGALGWWMYAIWYTSSIAALFFPIGAKYVRMSEGKSGKAFEIIALIIGVLVFMTAFDLGCYILFPNFPSSITALVDIGIIAFACVWCSKAKGKIDSKPDTKPEPPQESVLVCQKCGMKLQPESVYCQYCGKKVKKGNRKKSFAKLAVILILILCIVIVGVYSFYLTLNYQNGIAEMNNQNFISAQRYFEKIPYADKLFPNEFAYIDAGVLIEQGRYFDSLKAFDSLDGIIVPISIIENISQRIIDEGSSFELFNVADEFHNISIPKSIKDSLVENIYKEAQEYYRTCNYSKANNEFMAIGYFKRSKDYRTLIDCRTTPSSTNYKKIVKLLDFEDAKEIILSTHTYLELYLDGEWKENGKSYYFEIKNGGSSYNLPSFNESGYYFLDNGYYSVGKTIFTSKKYARCKMKLRI